MSTRVFSFPYGEVWSLSACHHANAHHLFAGIYSKGARSSSPVQFLTRRSLQGQAEPLCAAVAPRGRPRL